MSEQELGLIGSKSEILCKQDLAHRVWTDPEVERSHLGGVMLNY